jgi:hypothetical protein
MDKVLLSRNFVVFSFYLEGRIVLLLVCECVRLVSLARGHVGTGAQRRALGVPAHLRHSHAQHHTTCNAHARL